MDFSPDEGQQAVADVVTSVLDRDNSWDALVSGGVTALAVPERLGGDGVGLAEIATAIGGRGTVSPALVTLGATAVLLDLAADAQQDRFLAGVGKGSIVTLALNEPGAQLPERPSASLAGVKAVGLSCTSTRTCRAGAPSSSPSSSGSGVSAVAKRRGSRSRSGSSSTMSSPV